MEPFSIHCVTCKSKLTVSKPSLLGQILACPKCGSMVQIPNSKPCESSKDTTVSPSPGYSEPAEPLPQQNDQTDTVEDFGYTTPSSVSDEDNAPRTSEASAPTHEESDDEIGELQQDSMNEWKDSSAGDKRKKLLISFSCISVLIIIAVITAFSFSTDDSAETVANSNQDNSQIRNDTAEQEDNTEPQAEDKVDTQATVEEEKEQTGQAEEPVPEEATEADSPSSNSESDTNPEPKDSMQEPGEEEPLPVAPEGLTPESPVESNPDEVSEDLDSVIDDVAPFLSNAPVGIENAAPVAKLPMGNNDNPSAPAAPVNIEAGLNFTVPQIDVSNPIPLNQFLEFLGTLGNIPFTFDFESLELAGLSHAAGVTHSSENQTIGNILTSVLEGIQLTHQIEDGHVLILASAHANPDIKIIIHKQTLPDMNTDEQVITTICQIVNTLLASGDTKIAKPVADQEEGEFHIEVSGNQRMQDRVRQLLDRIANPETGTGSYEALARPQYGKLFTMDFNDGVPLLQVLIYLNSNSDLQFQANWKNIWQSGWTPKSQVNVATEEEPLQECLEQILTGNGLSYIARINGVLEITTAEHALEANQVGLYDFSELPVTKRNALVKTLNELAENNEDDVAIRLVESIPDGRLGLSAPAAIHRLVSEQLK